MPDDDPYDLHRFITAQMSTYETALAELREGRKQNHWMWFIFRQLRGLGMSSKATFYGITSIAEARAYFQHPLLGPRLVECTGAVLSHQNLPAHSLFGSPDDMKFRSSMTLFAYAAQNEGQMFRRALDLLCDGKEDGKTMQILELDQSTGSASGVSSQ